MIVKIWLSIGPLCPYLGKYGGYRPISRKVGVTTTPGIGQESEAARCLGHLPRSGSKVDAPHKLGGKTEHIAVEQIEIHL